MLNFLRSQRRWLGLLGIGVLLFSVFTSTRAFADDPAAASAAPAADSAAPAADPVPDKTGAFQTTPTTYSVPGYTKPDPDKATTKDLAVAVDAIAQSSSHAIYSINFVWTLVCGFLVMFMQAGFALVETGLIRGKNAAHTMAMNFMVYAIGMFGFFVCGFAFMCGGANGTAIGGPGVARRNAVAGQHVHDRLVGERAFRLGPLRHTPASSSPATAMTRRPSSGSSS